MLSRFCKAKIMEMSWKSPFTLLLLESYQSERAFAALFMVYGDQTADKDQGIVSALLT
jgi:hypothetical protein